MKAFGMELRKIDNVQNLYIDVDIVLDNICEIEKQTTAHALQGMMKVDSFFSICTIDACAKVCSIVIPEERRNIYHAAHCIHWSEMTPEYAQSLCAMVLDDFRGILNPVINENLIHTS